VIRALCPWKCQSTKEPNFIILPPPRAERINTPWTRKHLSFDPLIEQIRGWAEGLPDSREDPDDTMADAIMSAFAMFSLKDPSLLAFQERRNDETMKNLYRIRVISSDTQMRQILDPLASGLLRPIFTGIFKKAQRGGALEAFVFYEGYYLLALDGTEYFWSDSIHCPCCLCRESSTGKKSYYHQMLAGALVKPGKKEVLAVAPEPIVKQDGDNKNDCERNAGKRFLRKFRAEHPRLPIIIVEDGLASNAPHIRLLKELDMRFLLIVKEDDHEHLWEEMLRAHNENRATCMSYEHPTEPGVTCHISFIHDLPLNKSNSDLRVNFLMYSEYASDGTRQKHFAWVTDLPITEENAPTLVAGGRARWKIENETFNTLKNQGYHFEHNYGHGQKNLSVVFAMLMMLAFLVDQTQEHCCPLFQANLQKAGSRRLLWERLRSHFYHFVFQSMRELLEAMLHDRVKEMLLPPRYPCNRMCSCHPPSG
jgi:hypothetical protein